ncbi:MAG: hypothetical protein HY201_04890 [Nitrospirae bacterium]|nr:hypothetical protein [Candidatus Troglogloeales bacterium]
MGFPVSQNIGTPTAGRNADCGSERRLRVGTPTAGGEVETDANCSQSTRRQE